MIGSIVALLLASGPMVHAYNPNAEEAWCASKPVPKEEGLVIPADGGWRSFPVKPQWCSPGVVIEAVEEHKAHGERGECPTVAAMWEVALRKAKRKFGEEK